MLFSASLLFLLFLLLSAFFSSSETAIIASNPYTLDYLDKEGSKRARLVKQMMRKLENLLVTILFGNTLVNTAAASVATFIFASFMPDKREAVLLATISTTFLILFFGEINPKTFAAYNPVKVALWFIHPLRLFIVLFYPFVKVFAISSRLISRSSREQEGGKRNALNEEETKILLTTGIKGMSTLRKKMIAGILDIGSRPVKEIMVPRPQIKAIEISSPFTHILDTILSSGYSRFPVYRGRLDNVEGLIHAKDIIPHLIDNKDFSIKSLLRPPLFVPESATVEKVLLQMQENTVHLAFVVDEFGNMEGIVTLEDIIEEIIGDIQDEYDDKAEEWFHEEAENVYLVKGRAPVKEIRHLLHLDLPQKGEYTTLAGFFLFEFGRIPREGDVLTYKGCQFIVEKMTKRHISLIRIRLNPEPTEVII